MIRLGQRNVRDRILQYISDYLDANGCSPSYREIASAVGLHSPSSVARHVKILMDNGRISAHPKQRSRALAPNRQIQLNGNDVDNIQRIRLEVADGGVICFDCNLQKTGTDSMNVSFTGIVDASQMKSNVSRVVRCSIDDGCTG